MTILTGLNQNGSSNNRPFSNLGNETAETKQKSKVWLRVGRTHGDRFIGLPLDQGIDTMQPSQIRGQNMEFAKVLTAQNDFLASLQKLGLSLAPGETSKRLNLEVVLYRVNEAITVDGDNEFAIDPNSLIAAE